MSPSCIVTLWLSLSSHRAFVISLSLIVSIDNHSLNCWKNFVNHGGGVSLDEEASCSINRNDCLVLGAAILFSSNSFCPITSPVPVGALCRSHEESDTFIFFCGLVDLDGVFAGEAVCFIPSLFIYQHWVHKYKTEGKSYQPITPVQLNFGEKEGITTWTCPCQIWSWAPSLYFTNAWVINFKQ